MRKMIKLISIIVLTLVSQNVIAHSEECGRWQYASLNFSSKSTIEGNELKRLRTFVLWEEPKGNGIWEDNRYLAGSIKGSLTDHFGISKVHVPSILNAIGSNGWEAYGFHTIQESETDQARQWQFKKCSN